MKWKWGEEMFPLVSARKMFLWLCQEMLIWKNHSRKGFAAFLKTQKCDGWLRCLCGTPEKMTTNHALYLYQRLPVAIHRDGIAVYCNHAGVMEHLGEGWMFDL